MGTVLMFSKQIDTILLPEVEQLLRDIRPALHERYDYHTSIKQWLAPIIDLSNFYVYPIDGITQAINWWALNEKRGIYKFEGDYEWVDNTGDEVLYLSVPNAKDGNYIDIPDDVPVVLDIAYVGTTTIKKIEIPDNVEKVFFSLSKAFGVGNIRTGWYFTPRPDLKLHNLTIKSQYYNYYAHQCAESIINEFQIDHVYNKFRDKQLSICDKFELEPSDSVWVGTSESDKYKELRRFDTIARLCLTHNYK